MARSKRKLAAAAAIYLLIKRRLRRSLRWENRTIWTKRWIMRRQSQGVYVNLLKELASEDKPVYRGYMRMLPENFQKILDMVTRQIHRQNTVMREAVSSEQRLALTLRFLATGETFRSISFAYRIGASTVSAIVKETCSAIYGAMKEDYLKMPNTTEEWQDVAMNFQEKWNYPLCIGALDGKHIRIKNPQCAGSEYFNYKKFYSIVLLALVDANYQFVYVDVGAPGRNGDAGVYDQSSLKTAIEGNHLNLPKPDVLPGTQQLCNYHVVADDAFAMQKHMMKPYSHRNLEKDIRIFNYRLSRARRVVENAFGILSSRFRVFLSTIELDPQYVETLVLASCCLHNFLVRNQSAQYISNLVDEENSSQNLYPPNLTKLHATRQRNAAMDAKAQREALKNYFFSGPGIVPWQDRMINLVNEG